MQGQAVGEKEVAVLEKNRYEEEDSAVFIDYSVDKLQLCVKDYPSLSIYMRNALAKNISSVRSVLMPEKVYFDWLLQLAGDNDDIQQQLFNFLQHLYHSQRQALKHYNKEFQLPLVKMASGSYLQIKDECCDFLCQIAQSAGPQQTKGLIKLIAQLQQKPNEQSKGAALGIAARILHLLDEEELQRTYSLLYKKVYSQASVRFKKQIIHSCTFFTDKVSQEFIDKYIVADFIVERSREPVWGIRKTCVEILPAIAALSEIKKQMLGHLLHNFLKDGSKIVRITAFKTIPEFLAKYGSSKVPQNLFELYCSLPGHSINKESTKQYEIVEKVAFYWPGILQLVGIDRWDKLKIVMTKLINLHNQDIKIPFASSIHHICRLLGPQLASKYILQVVNQLLNDSSEKITLAIIGNFSELASVFDEEKRQEMIDFFLVLQKNPRKWHIRLAVAKQLGALANLYSAWFNFQYLFPIALKLCNDSMSIIREQAAHQVHKIVARMDQCPQLQEMATQSVLHLAQSSVHNQRQTFAFMVRGMSQMTLFRKQAIDVLTALAQDKVVGVRVALARSLVNWQQQWGNSLQQIVQLLEKDQESVSQQLTQT